MIFNKIGIITNEKKDPALQHTKNLIEYLLGIGKKIGENIDIYNSETFNAEDLYKICDLFIVLGGDGTMLKIAPGASRHNIPVIGINLGRIGYMSEIEADEIELLGNLFGENGGYEIKNRMMEHLKLFHTHLAEMFDYAAQQR